MQALCCVCYYHNEVDNDDKGMVSATCWTALMVYEDGATEVM